MDWSLLQRHRQLLTVLGASSAVSVGLYVTRVIITNSERYGFIVWNLFLAWLPLFFAWQLLYVWRRQNWQVILYGLLWLLFLPNSFYVLTDLIHLRYTGETNLLFDVVLLLSFIFNGLVLGYLSLYLVHRRLLAVRGLRILHVHALMGGILLACSFAMYLGRYLRWNTWDIVLNPAGVLFDVSDRFIDPVAHAQTFKTTSTFFILLGLMYVVVWHLVETIIRSVAVGIVQPTPGRKKTNVRPK